MSKEVKHTPRPWVVRSYELAEGSTRHYFVEATSVVAGKVFNRPYGQEILADGDYPTKQADARLIAAAPEMLQALKIAVKRLEEIQYQIASPKQIEFLETIIAKAEGKDA